MFSYIYRILIGLTEVTSDQLVGIGNMGPVCMRPVRLGLRMHGTLPQ